MSWVSYLNVNKNLWKAFDFVSQSELRKLNFSNSLINHRNLLKSFCSILKGTDIHALGRWNSVGSMPAEFSTFSTVQLNTNYADDHRERIIWLSEPIGSLYFKKRPKAHLGKQMNYSRNDDLKGVHEIALLSFGSFLLRELKEHSDCSHRYHKSNWFICKRTENHGLFKGIMEADRGHSSLSFQSNWMGVSKVILLNFSTWW